MSSWGPQAGLGIQGWSHQQELTSPAGSSCCPKEHPLGGEEAPVACRDAGLADLRPYQHSVKPVFTTETSSVVLPPGRVQLHHQDTV